MSILYTEFIVTVTYQNTLNEANRSHMHEHAQQGFILQLKIGRVQQVHISYAPSLLVS